MAIEVEVGTRAPYPIRALCRRDDITRFLYIEERAWSELAAYWTARGFLDTDHWILTIPGAKFAIHVAATPFRPNEPLTRPGLLVGREDLRRHV